MEKGRKRRAARRRRWRPQGGGGAGVPGKGWGVAPSRRRRRAVAPGTGCGREAPTGPGRSGGQSEAFWAEALLLHSSSSDQAARVSATLAGPGVPGREWEQDSEGEVGEGGGQRTPGRD